MGAQECFLSCGLLAVAAFTAVSTLSCPRKSLSLATWRVDLHLAELTSKKVSYFLLPLTGKHICVTSQTNAVDGMNVIEWAQVHNLLMGSMMTSLLQTVYMLRKPVMAPLLSNTVIYCSVHTGLPLILAQTGTSMVVN